ncbi:chlorohydrolase [Streptococcus oralis subsp. oralis]|uniref:Chlorohydrolase n=1 Tax=Streptococcus oralis subsp. oralis TaxID=1891914 RepID=A0A1X1I2K5_STROR|nr:chlorohydrolase [Streptococcus oralis subsp. oralis]
MKIKGQTRKLAAGCSKHWFEVVDKAKLTRFKEIFEEYNLALL